MKAEYDDEDYVPELSDEWLSHEELEHRKKAIKMVKSLVHPEELI